MKVVSRKMEDGTVSLEALASVKEVNDAFQQAYIQFANKMGFQPVPGKSVLQIIQENTGIKDPDSIVSQSVLEYLGPFAVDKRGITPAFPAQPIAQSPITRGKELAFRLFVTPKPEFELTSYDPVSIVAPKVTIPTDLIESTLANIASAYSQFVRSDDTTPVKEDDTILLKSEALRNGDPFPGMTFPRRPYKVGQGYMPEGFDQNLIGMVVGETRSFTFEAPGYDSTFAPVMDKVQCTVTVIEKQEEAVPEVDDDFVKRFVPGMETREQLIEAIKQESVGEASKQQEDVLQDLAAKEVAKRFQGKISDQIYEHTLRIMIDNIKETMGRQNQSFEEYVANNGGEEQFRMMMLLEVRETLVRGFALDAVFRHAKLKVTDADINDVCRVMNPSAPETARKMLEESGRTYILRESAERMKAGKWLVKHAEITYEEEAAQ